MSKFQLKKIAFALSLSTALSAHAAGLGSMISSSKLGEPLNAEIELLAVTPAELNSIQATLASEQVYQDQMLEKPASYPFIKIEVGNNTKGQPILKLTSSQPITEAFLDMLIQVDWPTGRLVKEYTLLLDPPGFNSNYVSESAGLPVTGQSVPPATTNNTARVPETSQQPAPEPRSEPSKPRQSKPAAVPAPKQVAADEAANAEQALTTERGDTLYAIARQMKPDNVSVEQMLVALYQSNQQAFDGKNMNRLKVGKIIRMPDQATLDSVSRPQAKSLIAEHATNWQAYKNSLAKVVKESEASQTGGNTQQSAGKIGAAGEKPAPQAKPGKDVLKLSAGDAKSTTQADKAAAKASAAAEDATAKANAIKEEQSRAAALEKQVADMKKLMEMKNSAMAQAEKNAAQAATEPKAEVKPDAKVEPKPLEQAAKAPAEQTKVPPAAVVPEKPTPTAEPAKPELPVEEPAAETVQQPSFMHVLLERLKNISPVLPLALIALPVLLCVWALIRIRRKKQIDNFEDVIVTSPATEMQNNTVFGDTQAAASGDTSFLTDFSQSGVGGMIDSHDVDPIAEAEVYMAYGRDAQAEEILKDAIQKDPERQELKLKLLEIYQTTGNKAAFESLASDVYAKAGPADAAWSKVSAMGQKLDPENTLYQATPAAVSDVAPLADATVLPVAETQNEEDAYHFNFEAPALEFDGASEAVAAASADALPATSDDDALALDTFTSEPATQRADDTTLAFSEDAISTADSLRFEVEPASVASVEPTSDDVSDTLNVDDDLALTPKALDLPSLNLDDVPQSAEAASSKPLSATTGEQTLSSEDAVFDSLPELSLELGGPNDAIGERVSDDALEIEEISLGSADAALNETPAVEAAADSIAFPEISLDVADRGTASAEEIADEPEEVNTKLDLIQAYIDMEDVVGAKELIDEVIAEGGERQRQRASELLAKLV
ncbi:FimV/HubP family polar landmark protein [Methylophilus sp. OH31]|uniref:FimV/HubP family polar landmark protein n=1 Tax=Methylophilus sp. OH31 TaxID=1387312 RepID=UPI0004666B55|nr:FimV/HubP family polar landmark protein [Methylophilus sp. OH31]